LLKVVPYPVFPDSAGGKIRVVQLSRALARAGVDVTILTPWHPRQKPFLYQHEPFRLRQVPYPFLLPLLFTDRPLPYQYLSSFHPGLGWLAASSMRGCDIYHFEHPQFASLARQLPAGANVIYGSQNVEHDYVVQECRSEWAARVAKARVFALEKSLLERSQHIFAVSQADKDRFAELYPVDAGKITVAPNGIGDLRPLGTDQTRVLQRFPQIASYPSRAVYSGSDVEHNRAAVRFICDELAPVRPEVAFVIHGSCGRQFTGIGRPPNVFVDTDPFSFDNYAVTGFVGINPVTTGGGTNLKLLHYLSRGLPAVSTPFGMRGHEDFQRQVTVCDLANFSTALKQASAAPARDQQMLEKYRWDVIARTMLTVYERLAFTGPPAVAPVRH
jgi:hypothetical protein